MEPYQNCVIRFILASFLIGFSDCQRTVFGSTQPRIQVSHNTTEAGLHANSSPFMGNSTLDLLRTQNSEHIRKFIKEENFDFEVCVDFPIPHDKYKSNCCKYRYHEYAKNWNVGSFYLVDILEVMQRWDCEEFQTECKKQTWSLTEYSRLIYDLFCRRNKLEKQCYDDVINMAKRYGFQSESGLKKSWADAIESFDSSVMDIDDLTKPCVQVAFFDRKDGGVGRYHEIIERYVPFCGLLWEGYDYNTTLFRGVSPWTSMSAGCKASVLVSIVVIVAAGMTTIIGNALVLAVFATTPKLRNSQAIYKIALGIADLMVGIVVWPNMIVMQYLTYWKPRTFGPKIEQPYRKTANMTPYNNPNLTYYEGGGFFEDIFQSSHVATVGFFSTLGIVVSIYILLVASIDRFLAVLKPLKYNRFNAKNQAIFLCCAVWGISTIVCLLPIFVPGFRYKVMSSIFISTNGHDSMIFVFMELLIPLILSWIITAMTFFAYRSHVKARQKLFATNASQLQTVESRLAKTLTIMIGTFTLSTLPAICTTVAGFLLNAKSQTHLAVNITSDNILTTSEYLAIIILTSNSLWNFFIYSWRTKGFKEVKSHVLRTVREKTGLESIRRSLIRALDGSRRSENMKQENFRIEDSICATKKDVDTEVIAMDVPKSFSQHSYKPKLVDTTSNGVSSNHAISFQTKPEDRKPSMKILRGGSVFRSFTINARTDRLFESVMENIPEEIGIERDPTKL